MVKHSGAVMFGTFSNNGFGSNSGHLYGLSRNNHGHFILNSLESPCLEDTIHPTETHLYKTDLLFPFEYHTNEGDRVYESEA
jgi:hypothetical protein